MSCRLTHSSARGVVIFSSMCDCALVKWVRSGVECKTEPNKALLTPFHVQFVWMSRRQAVLCAKVVWRRAFNGQLWSKLLMWMWNFVIHKCGFNFFFVCMSSSKPQLSRCCKYNCCCWSTVYTIRWQINLFHAKKNLYLANFLLECAIRKRLQFWILFIRSTAHSVIHLQSHYTSRSAHVVRWYASIVMIISEDESIYSTWMLRPKA